MKLKPSISEANKEIRVGRWCSRARNYLRGGDLFLLRCTESLEAFIGTNFFKADLFMYSPHVELHKIDNNHTL